MNLLRVRFTHLSVRQRANLLARNQARRRHDVAALIQPEHADDYRAAVTGRLAKHDSIFRAER